MVAHAAAAATTTAGEKRALLLEADYSWFPQVSQQQERLLTQLTVIELKRFFLFCFIFSPSSARGRQACRETI